MPKEQRLFTCSKCGNVLHYTESHQIVVCEKCLAENQAPVFHKFCPSCGKMLESVTVNGVTVCNRCGFVIEDKDSSTLPTWGTCKVCGTPLNQTVMKEEMAFCPVCNTEQPQLVTTNRNDFLIEYGTLKKYKGRAPHVVLPNDINIIAAEAFAGKQILSVTLTLPFGNSLYEIQHHAFANCTQLKEICIDFDVYRMGHSVLSGCTALVRAKVYGANVTDGGSTHSLPASTFDGCKMLSDVCLGNITSIEYNAFRGCESLKKIDLPKNLQNIGIGAFCESGLEQLNLPERVSEIAESAFENCTKLKKADCNSVSRLGARAFAGCASLTLVNLGQCLQKLDREVFAGCALTELSLPATLTEVNDAAFADLPTLQKFCVDKGNRRFKDVGGNLYSADGTVFFRYAPGKTEESFVLPNTVTEVKSGAFCQAYRLKAVTLPESVEKIESGAFVNCGKLKIFCEVKRKPAGWHEDWNRDNKKVVWGISDVRKRAAKSAANEAGVDGVFTFAEPARPVPETKKGAGNAKQIDQQAIWRGMGLCAHCGGAFKGVFKKVCTKCGKMKDY